MSLTDPIADLLTRIRNASRADKKELNLPSSKMKIEVVKILKDEGYIRNYDVKSDTKQGILNISLKYNDEGESVISGLKRVSKPGCRIYCGREDIPKVLAGLGIVIISTSKGIKTGKQCQEVGVGGEVLCSIW